MAQEAANADRAIRSAASAASLATLQARPVLFRLWHVAALQTHVQPGKQCHADGTCSNCWARDVVAYARQGELAELGRRREAARLQLASKQAAASAASRRPAAPDGSAEALLAKARPPHMPRSKTCAAAQNTSMD